MSVSSPSPFPGIAVEPGAPATGPLPTGGAGDTAVRVTVVGPERRGDLALPTSETLGSLVPVLVSRLVPDGADETVWLLQRVGDRPLDPAATVARAGLLDGDVLHLVPAEDPMRELTYDDVSDGLAESVGRRGARWTPATTRAALLVLAAAAAALLAVVVGRTGSGPAAGLLLAVQAWLVALLAAGGALAAAGDDGDRTVELLAGLVALVFAALAGLGVGRGTDGVLAPDPAGLAVAGLGVALIAGALTARTATSLDRGRFAVWGGLAAAGVVAVLGGLLALVGLTGPRAAALVVAATYLAATLGPRAAIRLARLRVPALPRTAEELQGDVEPVPGRRLAARAGTAEGLLTVAVVAAGVTAVGAAPVLVDAGWAGTAFGAVLAAALVLQARVFVSVTARGVLLGAGALTAALLLVGSAPPSSTLVGPAVLVLVVVAGGAVVAAGRLPGSRPLPVWGHAADITETLLAVALLPLLLQVLGVFAVIRGLFG